jgi:hypothetical protein
LASPSWRSVPQHGPPGTAAAVVVVVEVSVVVVDTLEVEAWRAEAA